MISSHSQSHSHSPECRAIENIKECSNDYDINIDYNNDYFYSMEVKECDACKKSYTHVMRYYNSSLQYYSLVCYRENFIMLRSKYYPNELDCNMLYSQFIMSALRGCQKYNLECNFCFSKNEFNEFNDCIITTPLFNIVMNYSIGFKCHYVEISLKKHTNCANYFALLNKKITSFDLLSIIFYVTQN